MARGLAWQSPRQSGERAWDQRQNDVYGELLAAAHRLRDRVDLEDDNQRRLLTALADLAAKVWTEPDYGIWEMRDEPRHHLYSKLMCWVALDRAIDMAHQLRAEGRRAAWRSARDAIGEAILRDAWNEDIGAFTQSFGSSAIDASGLAIPIVGFLPPADPRVLATVEAIETS